MFSQQDIQHEMAERARGVLAGGIGAVTNDSSIWAEQAGRPATAPSQGPSPLSRIGVAEAD